MVLIYFCDAGKLANSSLLTVWIKKLNFSSKMYSLVSPKYVLQISVCFLMEKFALICTGKVFDFHDKLIYHFIFNIWVKNVFL